MHASYTHLVYIYLPETNTRLEMCYSIAHTYFTCLSCLRDLTLRKHIYSKRTYNIKVIIVTKYCIRYRVAVSIRKLFVIQHANANVTFLNINYFFIVNLYEFLMYIILNYKVCLLGATTAVSV